ncbi:dihydroxyacetone kinase subunit DhaK [Corynebacterium uropygiale]|uniref:phosphoenolpyruvate--glycerone phosphotransferase n=1 Tax=Corynebacterium uropygiale TaxID=1775911 RepID=A0A9X1QNT9_9CORY|nr:dihydroxyacetone kinase subunit DhaK [Corynebacterium uropygiale]MCF4005687.1 dihydroxyacetone kinase subunit DhaK [Corynebacterium uropygiale]
MKKLINDAEQVVVESLEGLALAHPDIIETHQEPLIVTRSAGTVKERGRVGLISGGGSGHEPLHAGFVGRGMLDAAVPGPVFTSPTPDPIMAATSFADQGAGVVYIVKNYTGDVLNFDTAAELAEMEDIEVEQVLVDDDVAVEDSTFTAGRRGVAGTVLVEKVAGASAERGDDLQTVARLARTAAKNVRSMGVALSACTVPHVGKPSFELGENEVECGVGIHGEPGCERIPMASADEITDILFDRVAQDLGLRAGESVVALVNGMGGTPSSELYIVYRRVAQRLAELGVEDIRPMVGNYVTSLEMRGVSVTLMRLDEELAELIDAPAHTIAWTRDSASS